MLLAKMPLNKNNPLGSDPFGLKRSRVMNSRENIYSLKGFDKVFKFTMKQTFKNKGYRASFIIFVLVMTFMGPIQYVGQRAGQGAAEEGFGFDPSSAAADNIYIYDNTQTLSGAKDVKALYESESKSDESEKEGLTEKSIHIGENAADIKSADDLKDKDVMVVIDVDKEGYKVSGIVAKDSKVKVDELDSISEIVKESFDKKRLENANLDKDSVSVLSRGVETSGVKAESDYLAEENKNVAKMNYMFYMLGFSMIVFIVVSMSTSFIITSVTEEKQSKLVESLLVSVRPMALLMGKVCGMLSYVVLLLVAGVIGSNLSNMVMKNAFGISKEEFGGRGFDFSIFKDFGITGGIALLVSIILAFLLFGMISGLFGSTCNKTEDIQNATGNVMTISMLCYFAAIAVGAMDKDIVNMLASIIPPFSFFVAPVSYVTGRIELPILLVSYVLQIILVVLVIRLSARSYRNLLLSDSGTPKFATILKSSKG